RRERRKANHAEKPGAKRARRGDADRASGFAAQRKGGAAPARCCVGGGPRNVEEDRRTRATVQWPDIGADENENGVVSGKLYCERGQQCDAKRGGESRHTATENAGQRAGHAESERRRAEQE